MEDYFALIIGFLTVLGVIYAALVQYRSGQGSAASEIVSAAMVLVEQAEESKLQARARSEELRASINELNERIVAMERINGILLSGIVIALYQLESSGISSLWDPPEEIKSRIDALRKSGRIL